jgi:hypothetical protein
MRQRGSEIHFRARRAQENHEDTKGTKMATRFITFVLFVSSW